MGRYREKIHSLCRAVGDKIKIISPLEQKYPPPYVPPGTSFSVRAIFEYVPPPFVPRHVKVDNEKIESESRYNV